MQQLATRKEKQQGIKVQISGIILKTALLEGITATGRFGFGLDSQSKIHHGYIGILWLFFDCRNEWAWALIFSDLAHHMILHLVTGEPEFP